MAKSIVDKKFKIKKKAGKGGWSYVVLTGIPASLRSPLGLVRVKGFVDTYELRQFNLLPMKNGSMLLPLKAPLRKAIKKKEGDSVRVTLFVDKSPVETPEEILDSLADSPRAYEFFLKLSDSNKKYYIDWIEDAKKIETKAARIVKMIKLLERGKKFWDWPAQDSR